MINKFKYLFLLVICAATFGSATNIFAQIGSSSFKQADFEKVVGFYEWAFETEFTSEQRSQYQTIKEEDFQKDAAGEKKSWNDLITNFNAISAKNESEQSKIRGAFVSDFIEQLRSSDDGNKEAKFLLSVYEVAQAKAERAVEAGGIGDISSLAGKWVWARTGTGVVNGSTGAWMGGNGSRFTYEFSANGNVKFTDIMNVMQGGCSQQIFKTIEGKATLNGNNLTIRWSPEKFTRDFSCDTANNYTKTMPAKTERYKISFKNDGGQKQLCLLGAECYSETK